MITIEIKESPSTDIKIKRDGPFQVYLYYSFECKFKVFNHNISKCIDELQESEIKGINLILTFPLIQQELFIKSFNYSDIAHLQSQLFDAEEMDTYSFMKHDYYIYLRQSFDIFIDFNKFIKALKS